MIRFPIVFAKWRSFTTRLVLCLCLVLAHSISNLAVANPFTQPICDTEDKVRYSAESIKQKITAFQVLTEEALSLRSESIIFLSQVKEKQRLKQPLLGADMRLLSAGAAELINQRKLLWYVATLHECWLDEPIPDDPLLARNQAIGITMSLSAALILYDNYLTAVALYQDDLFLRNHINEGDSAYLVPKGELRKVATSFTSAVNRARVRRGLIWYEKHAAYLSESDHDSERYLATLIEQSPSYTMVRKIRPLNYAGNLIELIGTTSVDTLYTIQNEGISLSSMIFGNVIGLVESRRGKLDKRPEIHNRLTKELRAGDVLLEKTPFRLTDSFIPGHWGHAAVWIGTESELRDLEIWNHPVVKPYHQQIRDERGVVEALRSGVEMNTLQHFMNVDDLAVLRQSNLNQKQRRRVILQALRQVGKAYDFSFDTQSTNKIVCSELVYHAYGEVDWPTERKLGRVVVSPDNIAQKAVDGDLFSVVVLYHDGNEIMNHPQKQLNNLIKPKVVALAYSGLNNISP
ncbi:MAG: YiiX/YebB-like N1pC/P60 family cysteine hydrolase [Candidatus Thiodiazotropha sp. 6PLUC1]